MKYEAFDVRFRLVWQPWKPLLSVPTSLQERKRLFAQYPRGFAVYRMRFTDSAGRLVSYVGETEKGFGGAGGRIAMRIRGETESFRHYDLQREIRAALEAKRPIVIDSLHVTSTISIDRGDAVIQGRAVDLTNADERMMLEALLAVVEREVGRVTLNARKRNPSERSRRIAGRGRSPVTSEFD